MNLQLCLCEHLQQQHASTCDPEVRFGRLLCSKSAMSAFQLAMATLPITRHHPPYFPISLISPYHPIFATKEEADHVGSIIIFVRSGKGESEGEAVRVATRRSDCRGYRVVHHFPAGESQDATAIRRVGRWQGKPCFDMAKDLLYRLERRRKAGRELWIRLTYSNPA